MRVEGDRQWPTAKKACGKLESRLLSRAKEDRLFERQSHTSEAQPYTTLKLICRSRQAIEERDKES